MADSRIGRFHIVVMHMHKADLRLGYVVFFFPKEKTALA